MHYRVFQHRHAFNSFAIVALLMPAADFVRREVFAAEPVAAEDEIVAEATAASEIRPVAAAPEAPVSRVPGAGRTLAKSAAPAAGPREAAVDEALRSLTPHVTRMSDPDALRIAFQAYYNYKAANERLVRKPYLYYVDMGLDNLTARGYVFDMEALTLVDGPFTVSHGHGSLARDGVPASFSNRPGSNASSLGLYLAQETYTFRGKSGGRAYASVGLRMRGESGEFNDAARRRGIVAHGAPYVTASRAGKSQGCPAMEQERARRLLPMLANGGVVFIYSPKDVRWLRADPWVQAERTASAPH